MKDVFSISKKPIGFQLRLFIMALIVLSFGLLASIMFRQAADVLLNKTLNEQQAKLEAVATTISNQFEGYLQQVRHLEGAFRNRYLQGLHAEGSVVDFASHPVTALSLGQQSLINSTEIVDSFFADTGAISTIFAKSGTDFVRISTSLRNPEGKRMVGSLLAQDSGAYKALTQGQDFYSQARLFGAAYLVYYHPLKDESGQVYGASFVGVDVEKASASIRDTVANMVWGDSGYSVLLGNSASNQGQFIYHTEENLLGKNSEASPYQAEFAKVFERESGYFQYPALEEELRGDKYMVFATIDGWNWKLAGGTYINEITKEINQLMHVFVIVAALCCLAVLILLNWVVKRITAPLKRAMEYMQSLGSGCISLDIPECDPQSKNEITQLNMAIKNMAQQLSSMVGAISSTSEALHETADTVSNDASAGLEKSSYQQDKMQQMASAIEELSVSAKSVAQQVEEIAVSVESADKSGDSSSALVSDMVEGIADLDQQLQGCTQAMNVVQDESMNIQSVTEMIDEVAEQINLLALNAAIEAARAGEQGRGFAVVAEEVRNLAHRTQKSVQEVVSIVSQLQSGIGSAVTMIDSSQQKSQQVNLKAAQAGEALQQVASEINAISSMAQTIAVTSEQQALVSEDVSSNAAHINELNMETRLKSQNTAKSAEQLQGLSKDLGEQMAYFS